MKNRIYLCVFVWWLLLPSLSKAEDVFGTANLNAQHQCVFKELSAPNKQWLFPWALIKDKNFKEIYVALLKREHLEGHWIAKLSGPAPKNRLFSIEGKFFLYARSCKQHECNTHAIYLVFDAQDKRIYGLLVENDSARWIGSPSACIKETLEMFARN